MSLGQPVHISERWKVTKGACVCACIHYITATVPTALQPIESDSAMLTSWLIHKMGSGVEIVKWLLRFPHAEPDSFMG